MSKVTYQYKAGDKVIYRSAHDGREFPGIVLRRSFRGNDEEEYYMDFTPRYGSDMLITPKDLPYIRFADEQRNLAQFDLQDLT